MAILDDLSELLQKGKVKNVVALVTQALEEGISPADILNEGLLKGMGEVGVKFKNNQVYVPEVLIAARALNKGLEILKPRWWRRDQADGQGGHWDGAGGPARHRQKPGVHDVVGAGLEVVDLGVDVSAEKFVAAVREHKPNIVAMSALLTTTMGHQGDVIEALKAEGPA